MNGLRDNKLSPKDDYSMAREFSENCSSRRDSKFDFAERERVRAEILRGGNSFAPTGSLSFISERAWALFATTWATEAPLTNSTCESSEFRTGVNIRRFQMTR
jgi:hypothetical protein